MANGQAYIVGPDTRLQPLTGGSPEPSEERFEPGAMVWRRDATSPLLEIAPPRSVKKALWRLLLSEGHEPEPEPQAAAAAQAWQRTAAVDDDTLKDLTHLPFVTIDGAGSRDLDQALYLCARDDGFQVFFAVADASYFVSPGSALWQQAIKRGASYYVPNLMVSMLPPALSEGLISLNPKVDRRAVVLEMRLDREGHCADARLVRARINSRAKLSFAATAAYLANREVHPLHGQPFSQSLSLLEVIGRLRLQVSESEDRLTLHRREIDVEIDGLSFNVVDRVRGAVERYVEELSLLCNVEAARLMQGALADPQHQPLFRVHPAPSSTQLERLQRVVEALISAHSLDHDAWRWRFGRESLASYLRRLPKDEAHRRIRAAVERQALLSQRASAMSAEPGPHYGVAADAYARFSAPMREIAGIFSHKELLEASGLVTPEDPEQDQQLRRQVIDASQRARTRQRRLDKAVNALVLDHWFQHDVELELNQRWRRGTLVNARATKLYVQLDEGGFEVKIYLASLPSGVARVDATGALMTIGDTRYALGDAVEICALRRDDRGWAFDLRSASKRSKSDPIASSSR